MSVLWASDRFEGRVMPRVANLAGRESFREPRLTVLRKARDPQETTPVTYRDDPGWLTLIVRWWLDDAPEWLVTSIAWGLAILVAAIFAAWVVS